MVFKVHGHFLLRQTQVNNSSETRRMRLRSEFNGRISITLIRSVSTRGLRIQSLSIEAFKLRGLPRLLRYLRMNSGMPSRTSRIHATHKHVSETKYWLLWYKLLYGLN